MRKTAFILAVLMLFSMLAACQKEENIVTVPGYQIHLNVNGAWTVADESAYDLELNSGDLKICAVAYADHDFVDPPSAEDLYIDHNDGLVAQYEGLQTTQEVTSYTKDSKTIWTSKYVSGDQTIYSCMVSFDNEAGSCIWIAISGPTDRMDRNIKAFVNMVEGMTCDAEPVDWEAEEDLVEDIVDEYYEETEAMEEPPAE